MVMDVVNDTLDLMTALVNKEVAEYLVLDYTDAFFRTPSHPLRTYIIQGRLRGPLRVLEQDCTGE